MGHKADRCRRRRRRLRRRAGEPMDTPRGGLPKRHLYHLPVAPNRPQKPLATGSQSGPLSVSCSHIMTYTKRTRSRIDDLKLQNAHSELQLVNSKLQIVDLELQNLDSKLRVIDLELQVLDSKLQDLDLKLQDVRSKLQPLDSKLQMLESKLQNHAKMAGSVRRQRSATPSGTVPNTPQTSQRGWHHAVQCVFHSRVISHVA